VAQNVAIQPAHILEPGVTLGPADAGASDAPVPDPPLFDALADLSSIPSVTNALIDFNHQPAAVQVNITAPQSIASEFRYVDFKSQVWSI
jgi:hypothetical protein